MFPAFHRLRGEGLRASRGSWKVLSPTVGEGVLGTSHLRLWSGFRGFREVIILLLFCISFLSNFPLCSGGTLIQGFVFAKPAEAH